MRGMEDLFIVKYPAPVLRRPAARIAAVDEQVRERARAMFAAMYRDKGVGLAAPQVDWSARLFVMNPSGEPGDEHAYENPEITWRSKEKAKASEGCLSLPDVNGKVERPVKIRLSAQDLEGKAVEVDLDGFPARVAQHEIDHLDGVLIIDRFSMAEKSVIEPRLREMREEAAAGAKPRK